MILAYCLTDPACRHVWCGPGMRKLHNGLSLSRLPFWGTKAEAQRAADALRKAIGLRAVPSPLKTR